MRLKDTLNVLISLLAVIVDSLFIFAGFMLAIWVRFDSGLPTLYGRPDDLYQTYIPLAKVATLVFLFVYKSLGLYVRPQTGNFSDKIPRIVRATGIGLILSTVLAFAAKNFIIEISNIVLAISFVTVSIMVLVERGLLYRAEITIARRSRAAQRILILGTDATAAHLMNSISREPRLRSEVAGFLALDENPADPGVPVELVLGGLDDLPDLLVPGAYQKVILTNSGVGNQRIVEVIMLCEKTMTAFNMVPDLLNVMTGNVEVQSIDDIPVLGIKPWPLDNFWNRLLKRGEDIAGALVGLLLSAPVMTLAALIIKCSSRGPVLYPQERCGEDGRLFTLYKLRTMRADSEDAAKPGWTVPNDPRRTRFGSFLRAYNLDELPQLWNVLLGSMSLVGPRPERPHFVEKFREDIQRYMWRHVSKPGLTGWAQVNGLRGDTSITERIKYDLYYLENWSLTFDFKILLRTFFTRTNAY